MFISRKFTFCSHNQEGGLSRILMIYDIYLQVLNNLCILQCKKRFPFVWLWQNHGNFDSFNLVTIFSEHFCLCGIYSYHYIWSQAPLLIWEQRNNFLKNNMTSDLKMGKRIFKNGSFQLHRETIVQLGYNSDRIVHPFSPLFYPHRLEYPPPFI